MIEFKIKEKDIAGLRNAIRRNPAVVLHETGMFLKRGIASYYRTLDNNPWRLGQAGGGIPVDTGGLRESHKPAIYKKWEARIKANRTGTAPYAEDVHRGSGRMHARPWLDYAVARNKNEIDLLQRSLLDKVLKDLEK